MTHSNITHIASPTGEHAGIQQELPQHAAPAPRLRLVAMPSAVAASRTRRVHGNAHAQSWTLFATREQFDAFLATDPLRFEDPVRFAQLRKEFAHAFDSPNFARAFGSARERRTTRPRPWTPSCRSLWRQIRRNSSSGWSTPQRRSAPARACFPRPSQRAALNPPVSPSSPATQTTRLRKTASGPS